MWHEVLKPYSPKFKNYQEFEINPSRADPGRSEKIKLSFYFHIFLWGFKRFHEDLKGPILNATF